MSNISFGVNILPKTSSVTIGNSEAPWKIHANQINGHNTEDVLLPEVSSSDNGKVLKVVEGDWTTADAPSGLPSVTSSDNGKVLEVSNGEWAVGNEKIDKQYESEDKGCFDGSLSDKTWSGLTSLYGDCIWTDGENIYYSSSGTGTPQYILDKSTSTWSAKTWSGLTSFNGNYVWTDGENIYYSSYTDQYVLNKSTSTWSAKTWGGLNIDGNCIWTDGKNIYYSSYTNQYVLNKATSTWSTKTWNGYSAVLGSNIWIDGENIYYSNGSAQYILDKSTSTWSAKTWTGLTSFFGLYIFTDGENIYYSNSSNQYVLDKSTSTWTAMTWSGVENFTGNGSNVWTDGKNHYYSSGSSQYMFGKIFRKYLLLGQNGEFSPVNASGMLLPSVSVSDNGKVLTVDSGEWVVSSIDNALIPVAFEIATTDWTAVTSGYSASITNSHIDANTVGFVVYDASLYESGVIGINDGKNSSNTAWGFTVNSMPTGAISGTLYLFNATPFSADGKVDVAQGIQNAGKVLTINSSGNVIPATLDALPTVSASDNGKVLRVVQGGWAVATYPAANQLLPAPPMNDGTYFLQCSVSNGSATYSWVNMTTWNGGSY